MRVITPHEVKYEGDANMVSVHCHDGDIGILPGHDRYSVLLEYGALRYYQNREIYRMAVFGGIADITGDTVTVLTTEAIWPWEISHAHAQAERERLERRMLESDDDMEIQRDQVLLRRALVHIEVSSGGLISKPDWMERE